MITIHFAPATLADFTGAIDCLVRHNLASGVTIAPSAPIPSLASATRANPRLGPWALSYKHHSGDKRFAVRGGELATLNAERLKEGMAPLTRETASEIVAKARCEEKGWPMVAGLVDTGDAGADDAGADDAAAPCEREPLDLSICPVD